MANKKNDSKKEQQIGPIREGKIDGRPVLFEPGQLRGGYSNVAVVSHTRREFVIDFLMEVGGQTHFVYRIITSPGHAKALARALNENVKKYETSIGEIEPELKEPESDSVH